MTWKPNSVYNFNSKFFSAARPSSIGFFMIKLAGSMLCQLLGFSLAIAMPQNENAVQHPPTSAAEALEFADNYSCNERFPHFSFCEAVQFKAWTSEEQEQVTKILRSFKGPRFQKILQHIQRSGFNKLHRVSFSSSWYPKPELRRVEFIRRNDKVLLWVNPTTKVVGFTDAFFTGTPYHDLHVKKDRKEINILHELIHVFDITSDYPSTSDEFKKAAALSWNGKNYDTQSMSGAEIQEAFKKIIELVKLKRSKEAYALDREMGIKNGFPTLYGMTSLQEGFAEVVAYYLLDPQAPKYYSPELQAYLDSLLDLNK